jgi:hypothetical protein
MTTTICWKKTIANTVAPIAGPINVWCEGRCDGRFDLWHGLGSLRRFHQSMRRMGPKLPTHLRRRTIARRRRVAFGQHFVEKMMSCGLRHCAAMS